MQREFCEDASLGQVTAQLKQLISFLPHVYLLSDTVFGHCCLLACSGAFAGECLKYRPNCAKE